MSKWENAGRADCDEAPVSVARLREIGLFGALSDRVLEYLISVLKVVEYDAGQTIFSEGDAARELYVVLDGEVEVLKQTHAHRDVRVAILGPSDAFGEMAMIDVQPRSATVRAVAPSRLLRIRSEDLDIFYRQDVRSYALITLNVARALSRRLRVADGLLADYMLKSLEEEAKKRQL